MLIYWILICWFTGYKKPQPRVMYSNMFLCTQLTLFLGTRMSKQKKNKGPTNLDVFIAEGFIVRTYAPDYQTLTTRICYDLFIFGKSIFSKSIYIFSPVFISFVSLFAFIYSLFKRGLDRLLDFVQICFWLLDHWTIILSKSTVK